MNGGRSADAGGVFAEEEVVGFEFVKRGEKTGEFRFNGKRVNIIDCGYRFPERKRGNAFGGRCRRRKGGFVMMKKECISRDIGFRTVARKRKRKVNGM